ncbi:hypothetical protein NQ317_002099 [Molorchus minor]|uniref:Uncharacterized protein n=1 Tax=Molorchus minor TaxID=1323400 RepID=A0ABQ9JVH0_9CUCU|nr:hypothetical protein NQ317_002099 [Molorchus minor]
MLVCVSVMSATVVAVGLSLWAQVCAAQEHVPKSPPRVDKPLLLNSFIPATTWKPTARPPVVGSGTTSTTMRPTPPHRPAIYAPAKPPGAGAYYSQKREYIDRLQRPSGSNYFDRYRQPLAGEELPPVGQTSREGHSRNLPNVEEDPIDYELYFGKGFSDLVALEKRIEPDVVANDVDVQVQQFAREYDDSDFRFESFRQKKVPPTKAYVTLLSLYDLLNKESKRLGLNKYQGYSDEVLQELIKSSMGTSAYQLRMVINKVVERGDTRKQDIVKKINQLIADLDEPHSYINEALKDIPPLPYAS